MRQNREAKRLCASAIVLGAWACAALMHAQTPVSLDDPSTIARMTMAEFTPLQAKGKAFVIDTRDPIAFEGGRIPGALNVPLDQTQRRAEEIRRKAAGRPIVLYCSCPSEHTSAEAGLILYKHGIKDVRALVGGYVEWVRSGGTVER